MSKLSLEQIKNIPINKLFAIIDRARKKLRSDSVIKEMFKEYDVDLDELDLIPIAFADLDVSARTEHGVIYLNYLLLKDGDFEDKYHYLVHEITHFLQQTTGNKPTKGSTEDNYLDNEAEKEGFQNQTKHIAKTDGKQEAKKYIEKVLEHHDVPKKDKKKRIDELLVTASKNKNQLSFPGFEPESNKKEETKVAEETEIDKKDYRKKILETIREKEKKSTLENFKKIIEAIEKNNPDSSSKLEDSEREELKNIMHRHNRPNPFKMDEGEKKSTLENFRKIIEIIEKSNPKKIKSSNLLLSSFLKKKSNEKYDIRKDLGDNLARPEDREDTDYDPNQLKLQLKDFSKINFYKGYYKNLYPSIKEKLKKFCVGYNSSMYNFIENYQPILEPEFFKFEPSVIVAGSTDDDTIFGWALLTPFDSGDKKIGIGFDILVDRKYRNEGIGTRIIEEAKKYIKSKYGNVHMVGSGWNSVGRNFYAKNNLNPFQDEPIKTVKTHDPRNPDALLSGYNEKDWYELSYSQKIKLLKNNLPKYHIYNVSNGIHERISYLINSLGLTKDEWNNIPYRDREILACNAILSNGDQLSLFDNTKKYTNTLEAIKEFIKNYFNLPEEDWRFQAIDRLMSDGLLSLSYEIA